MGIIFDNKQIPLAAGQSVLTALLEQGYDIPNSCRAGVCQSCLMQAVEGQVPAEAQHGLKDTLKAQGYFLACSCQPESDLVISLPAVDDMRQTARVIDHCVLSEDVVRLRLQPEGPFDYRPGQYTTLWNADDIGRSYSLASVPQLDDFLELHVRRIEGGVLSNWLFESLKTGDCLAIQGAVGDCFYVPGNPDQPLILAGTGTGLSPLVGIARDALQQGHRGDIHLYHGAINPDGLYMHQGLMAMAEQHAQFHYHASVLTAENLAAGMSSSSIDELLFATSPALADCKIYLCGAPDLVNTLKKKLFLSGASMSNIYTDPFIMAPPT